MEDVTVVFVNGSIVSFVAQEFDVNLKGDNGSTNECSCKDAQGQGSFIHIRPNQVLCPPHSSFGKAPPGGSSAEEEGPFGRLWRVTPSS